MINTIHILRRTPMHTMNHSVHEAHVALIELVPCSLRAGEAFLDQQQIVCTFVHARRSTHKAQYEKRISSISKSKQYSPKQGKRSTLRCDKFFGHETDASYYMVCSIGCRVTIYRSLFCCRASVGSNIRSHSWFCLMLSFSRCFDTHHGSCPLVAIS